MTVEENVRVVDAQADAFNARDLEACLAHYAEDVVRHAPGMEEPLRGKAGLRALVRAYWTAFPDIHAEKVRTFGQEDWVCRENRVTGTHEGPLTGPDGSVLDPTNRSVDLPICHVYRLAEGKIVEDRQYLDFLGLLAQLGQPP